MKLDLKRLSGAAVAFLRKSNNVLPIWNEELKIISGGLNFSDIEINLKILSNKFSIDNLG